MNESERSPVVPAPVVEIVPFWNRLREIALYPAHPAALSTISVLAVCHLVRFLPFGFLLDVFVWVAMYKYGFECLRVSADGRLEPPEVSIAVDDSLGWKQIWLQFAFLLLSMFAFWLLGNLAGSIVLVILGLAWPGALMSLAMDENLEEALNPSTWLAILTRIGWPYVAVTILYFVLFACQNVVQAMVFVLLPSFLAIILVSAIAHYVIVATFHLMGYLIYQYHDEVGYEPGTAGGTIRRPEDDPQQFVLDEAERLAQENRPEAACDLIGTELRGRGGSEALHAHYRRLLALVGRSEEQLRHGREWITVLLGLGKDRRAVDVARECLEIDPEFQPAEPAEVTRIARKAVETGAPQLALRLVSVYYRRHPEDPDIPQNGLLAAKLLAERMGKEDAARTLLQRIARDFPDHPLAAEIAGYLKFLDTVAAPSGISRPRPDKG